MAHRVVPQTSLGIYTDMDPTSPTKVGRQKRRKKVLSSHTNHDKISYISRVCLPGRPLDDTGVYLKAGSGVGNIEPVGKPL
jgi:hypothetical protein